MSLTSYQQKHDFSVTSEPKGKEHLESHKELIFIIQKHAASHLHYDFRLEMEGVLKSWAVPKGPSYQSSEKRLAVEVEDHPLEYGNFEGTIPEGHYGGGTVMLWDKGTWTPFGDPLQGYKEGKLVFVLHGEKMRGLWALVKMASNYKGGGKPNWLLIKKHDKYSDSLTDEELLDTVSVKSGKDLNEIAKKG